MWETLLALLLCVLFYCGPCVSAVPAHVMDRDTADANYLLGSRLLQRADPETGLIDHAGAAEYLYSALIRRRDDCGYSVDEVFTRLLHAYRGMGEPEKLYLRIGHDYLRQGDWELARNVAHTALELNPRCAAAHLLLAASYTVDMAQMHGDPSDTQKKINHLHAAEKLAPRDLEVISSIANTFWGMSGYTKAAEYFDKAYVLNSSYLSGLANAVYTRSFIADWGSDGRRFDEDMRSLVLILGHEERMRALGGGGGAGGASVVQPHMSLGYDVPADLKLAAAQAHAEAELEMAREAFAADPTNHSELLPLYRKQAQNEFFRIRVGYVSANIKSKTTVYMAQDLLRFHDRSKFEVHVYATTPPDTEPFLQLAMRGRDWRKKVASSVEHFHDVAHLDVLQLYRLIRAHGIHILLNWDGYSNNGIRPTGLFAMQPSPIQIAHQEYIGTLGADYIQYMITDPVASPRRYESFYSEKFIWLPSSFLATSMAYLQPDMQPPSEAPPHPERRGCGGAPASFVYCNFNKHLKFDPHVFREWLRILQSVPDSVLCLLENPRDSLPNIWGFVDSFDPSLTSRVRFQEFMLNPFDNQRRDAELCNAVLDTPRYNGHTTAADNLWAGVPIVAYGNSVEMGGRVGASILMTLGMPELIAMDQEEYNSIAIRMGLDQHHYLAVRAKLVAICLGGTNPYWDLQRYMKNLENGLQIAFFSFLNGRDPAHIRVPDVYETEGRDGARCEADIDGTCSTVAAEVERWSWAGPDALEAFYTHSVDDIRRDDEKHATITPEPQLDYHGVTQDDIYIFSEFTVQGITPAEPVDYALADAIIDNTGRKGRPKKRRREGRGADDTPDAETGSGKRRRSKAGHDSEGGAEENGHSLRMGREQKQGRVSNQKKSGNRNTTKKNGSGSGTIKKKRAKTKIIQ